MPNFHKSFTNLWHTICIYLYTMSKEQKETILKLLSEYTYLKDRLLYYTEEHHDAMLWDIEGYYESIEEGHYYTEELKKQIKAFNHLLEFYKALNYVHG